MRHIDEFTIQRFRGIQDLKLEGLGQINLLVGDNNSGKTSVLEALSIFCDPLNWRKWSNAASAREAGIGISSLSQSERLAWLFPQGEDDSNDASNSTNHEILVSALGSFPVEKVSASYEQFSETIQDRYRRDPRSEEGEVIFEVRDREVQSIRIDVSTFVRRAQQTLPIPDVENVLKETFIFPNSRPLPVTKKREVTMLPTQIINPSSHRLSSTPSQLWTDVINAEAKSDAIKLLQSFDRDIQDVDNIIGSAERPTVSVKHKKLKRAPLSIFGDGLRRVFTLAAAIPGARGGVLLIDELEMAIHTDVLRQTFDWLMKACIQNNVQLVATTHSLEALDMVIAVCPETIDLVTYRLQKGEKQKNTKRFDKETLTRLREELGLEVR